MLSPEEESAIIQRIRKGDTEAENELVKANLRFVISVAKSYQGKGLDLVDLIQEGNCGLLEGSRKYNPDKGIKFITYAVWWIRQAIIKALSDQCRTVRVPISQTANLRKVNKAFEQFEKENGRAPMRYELEEQTNLNSEKISASLLSTYRSVSLETPFNDEEDNCLLDVLPNENVNDTDEVTLKNDISREINRLISKLPNREGDILKMSFGIDMQQLPNDEIAKRFGIGEERVRQIVQKAIDKMRKRYGESLKALV